jgi:RimJ/RimL family protein N-acetyltransferase
VRAVTRDGRLVGSIDLKHTDWAAGVTEIGYWAAPEARGNGYLAEATEALARWTLAEVGFHRVELRIAAGNAASRRVAEKAGFRAEGVARSAGYVHGGRVDLVLYSLVRSELGLPA